MRTTHGRPLALTGARDGTVRVWDVRAGREVRVLEGHRGSVRCLDVNGGRCVSGSYDTEARVSFLWSLFFFCGGGGGGGRYWWGWEMRRGAWWGRDGVMQTADDCGARADPFPSPYASPHTNVLSPPSY
jgi:hypothetical protein